MYDVSTLHRTLGSGALEYLYSISFIFFFFPHTFACPFPPFPLRAHPHFLGGVVLSRGLLAGWLCEAGTRHPRRVSLCVSFGKMRSWDSPPPRCCCIFHVSAYPHTHSPFFFPFPPPLSEPLKQQLLRIGFLHKLNCDFL